MEARRLRARRGRTDLGLEGSQVIASWAGTMPVVGSTTLMVGHRLGTMWVGKYVL